MIGICAVLVLFAASACGSGPAARSVTQPPRYPNFVGTAVALRPDNGGEFFAPQHDAVTLTFADGRRLVVPRSVQTLGARGLLCRTRDLNRADGTYGPPCHLQAFVANGRARWIEVIGAARVGMAVMGSDRWLVFSDGTALPLPAPPRYPAVNCRGIVRSGRVDGFNHAHHLVRVEVGNDGTLARVDCLSSLVKP